MLIGAAGSFLFPSLQETIDTISAASAIVPIVLCTVFIFVIYLN
ncbi:hypothetical protein NMS_2085 [Nonlabens marinus S1-08]|uniref:Uncharacterized protein n=1 Tax=Nonlabens marinus S1-08 TaxID=1454201 RepID=W8VR55_9FLAO|nr:hypothetical protein NMS_2085 [Nonlabens marinus S1-08]